ncbi:MAG: membrane-bound O-acyltransferase family protein [Fluviicola sp.]|nr:MAG: membrane-bound O-acyltransferase family protein [Fluviicola sp.]
MLFNSFIFFIFLGAILPIFYFLPNKQSKNIFLVISSYFFYGYWDWRFCGLLAISTVIDFYIGRKIYETKNTKKRKLFLIISLVSNLGILAFFKYFNFFVDSFVTISENIGWNVDFLHLNILLPVGISFYTFQTLSYTIDVFKKKLEPTKNFIDFALFVSFFPQLVAGPIERAKALLPQLSKKLTPSIEQIKAGITLIVLGLFRKVMIGDTAGRYVDSIFGDLNTYMSIELIVGLVLFSIQIYADFSGYSHMARGTAKLLGVELMKNFEQPYFSRNITEFWRRWHISLSSWLKDYLYISLGGNRNGKFLMYRNLMITMLLGGLWHGASWNFVIWGGLHGVYLTIHKFFSKNKIPHSNRIKKLTVVIFINILTTYILVLFTWLFFRSTSWETTELFFSKIINWESSEHSSLFISIACTYLLAIITLDIFEYVTGKHSFILLIKSSGIRYGILSALFLVSLIYMLQAESLPFIYFQF